MSSSDLLFSLRDSDIYGRDAILFEPSNWLNDSCINFCFRLLEDKFNLDESFLLLDPSVVSFLIIQATDEDDIGVLASSLNVLNRSWLLIPINDNVSFDRPSKHWSLMICHVISGKAFHFDSCGDSNTNAASIVSQKISLLLRKKVRSSNVRCSQQRNNFDCGVYLLLFAEAVISYILTEAELDILENDCVELSSRLLVEVTSNAAIDFRRKSLLKIEELKRE